MLGTAVGMATVGGLALGGAGGGLIGLGGVGSIGTAINQWRQLGPSARFRPDDGRLLWMNRLGMVRARLAPPAGEADFSVEAKARGFLRGRKERFEGENAVRVLDAILPRINAKGGSGKTIRSAVSRIESAGRPERLVKRLAHRQPSRNSAAGVQMSTLAEPTRLALEMALNEERERRALEGELWLLERRWKEAEEIAAISDNLLLPASTDELHDRHREGS